MANISNKWFGKEDDCPEDGKVQPFEKLTLASFTGLFWIAGLSSLFAVIMHIAMFLYKNREILSSEDSMHNKMIRIKTRFFEEENITPLETETETIDDSHERVEENAPQTQPLDQTVIAEHQVEGISSPRVNVSPTINVEHQVEGVSSPRVNVSPTINVEHQSEGVSSTP